MDLPVTVKYASSQDLAFFLGPMCEIFANKFAFKILFRTQLITKQSSG